jgi:hypothetical protein
MRTAMRRMPGGETGTYRPKNPHRKPLSIRGIRFRPINVREFQSAGITVTSEDAVAIVPNDDAFPERPAAGDVLTMPAASDWAGGWTVLGYLAGPLVSEFRCAVTRRVEQDE